MLLLSVAIALRIRSLPRGNGRIIIDAIRQAMSSSGWTRGGGRFRLRVVVELFARFVLSTET